MSECAKNVFTRRTFIRRVTISTCLAMVWGVCAAVLMSMTVVATGLAYCMQFLKERTEKLGDKVAQDVYTLREEQEETCESDCT